MSGKLARPYRQTARAEATQGLRERIVRAFLVALKSQWLDDITLDDVAVAARTTRQTVIRMYGGKEGLLKAAVEIWPAEIEAQVRPPEATTVEALASAMIGMLEELGDMYFRVLCLAPRHPELEHFTALGRARHRQWFTEALTPNLRDRSAVEIETVINECLIATDTYTWSLLRRTFGKGADETQTIMADMMRKALGQTPLAAAKT
jgi:AcrR family transcriptional regulator